MTGLSVIISQLSGEENRHPLSHAEQVNEAMGALVLVVSALLELGVDIHSLDIDHIVRLAEDFNANSVRMQ